jgi:hypothetical protein
MLSRVELSKAAIIAALPRVASPVPLDGFHGTFAVWFSTLLPDHQLCL